MPKKASTKKQEQLPLGPPLRLPDGVSSEIEPNALLLDPQNLRPTRTRRTSDSQYQGEANRTPSVQNKISKRCGR
jgi:hypothetical protein